MHILVIPSEQYLAADLPLGGVFQAAQVAALARGGHQVGVLAPKARSLRSLPRGLGRWPVGRILDVREGIPTYSYLGWLWIPERTPYLYVNAFVKIGLSMADTYVERYGRPDLIHAHGSLLAGSLAAALRKRYGIPTAVTEHSSSYLTGQLRPWTRRVAARAWRSADARIVVSSALGEAIDRELSGRARTWMIIPNCLDRAFEEQDTAFRQPGHADGFMILSVGSLVPIKNHASLLRAFADAFPDDASVRLSIAGDGPLRTELEALARDLRVRERVRFLGQLGTPSVIEEMRNCDLFVLPSVRETFGVVLIEALACGRPVLATSCGGPESIVTALDGILVRSGSVANLAGGLCECQRSILTFDSLGIRQRCLQRFGQSAVGTMLEDTYRKTLGQQ